MSECFNKYFIYNSEIKKCEDFHENVLDKGKSLYEVIRIIDGKPLFLNKHLERIENSSKISKLDLWIDKEGIKEKILQLIKVNCINSGNIKFLFNFEENFLEKEKKRTFICYFVKHHYPELKDYQNGVHTILYHGERKNPNAKIINMSFRAKVDKERANQNAFEAILVDRNNYITEGSKSNIFMVKNSNVITAPLEDILPGVTRDVIINLCKKLELNIQEEKIDYRNLKNLDALFISGTSPKVLPIKSVENINFNSAQNEIVIKIMKEYDLVLKKDISNCGS
jgi:branched-chain amino acid aminotransferase